MRIGKLSFLIVAIIMSCLVFAGCSNGSSGSSEKASDNSKSKDGGQKYTIKLGTVLADNEPINQYAEKAAKAIKEKTNGNVDIQVYPNSTLGSNKDTYEQILSGAQVIGHGDPGYYQDYVPDIGVLNGPYVVKDPKDFQTLTESDWFAGIKKQMADKGLTVLSLDWYFGPRHMISNKAIKNQNDFKGMKVRISPNTMWKETFEALGANPTQLEWSEVYSALETGVVDAAEAPLSTIYSSKLYEVADTVSLTSHFNAISGFVIGTDFFNSLPEDYQKIILDEFKKYGLEETQATIDSQNDWIEKLKGEGVKIVDDVDKDALQKATEPVYTKFDKWSPGLHDKIQEILNK